MATHFSILAWKNPMDRGALQAAVHRITQWDTEHVMDEWMCYMRRKWFLTTD